LVNSCWAVQRQTIKKATSRLVLCVVTNKVTFEPLSTTHCLLVCFDLMFLPAIAQESAEELYLPPSLKLTRASLDELLSEAETVRRRLSSTHSEVQV
jgi:hypothetical protein